MRPHPTLLAALAIVALGSGCVGSGPNTQQGAVSGALAGALVGGVVGNNRGSGNALGGAAIGAAAGGIGGAIVGNSLDHQRGTLYDSPAREAYGRRYVVEQPPLPPPPPPERVAPRPARQAVWVPGYYAYVGAGNYAWVPGHWEVPPPRYSRFENPRWVRQGQRYVYVDARWR